MVEKSAKLDAERASRVLKSERADEVAELSHTIFGRVPKRIAFPGGFSRSAFVVDMEDDGLFVFAKRSDTEEAFVEAEVLRVLSDTGLVPRLKAVSNRWVVQECMDGQRLPIVLDGTDSMEEREAHVVRALDALAMIHEKAASAGLDKQVPRLGVIDNWVWNRTGAAKRMSKDMGIKSPKLNRHWMTQQMTVKRDDFVKWDARPGNALVDGDNVYWFDWEDCGRGFALEDLSFLLCDEWLNLDPEAELRLEKQFIPRFSGGISEDNAIHYLRVFGVTHTVIRLRMALKYRLRDGAWWDRQKCLLGDKVGVTENETSRLIFRGKRLANDVPQLRPIIPWLNQVAEHFAIH